MMHWVLFTALTLLGVRQAQQAIAFAKESKNFYCLVEIGFAVAAFLAAGESVKSWLN